MKLKTYDSLYIESLIRKRSVETKLGEMVKTLPWGSEVDLAEQLLKNDCKYVLMGLPEDIGVRANGGRGGAYSAWLPVVTTLLNTQSNRFLKGDELLILGHIDFSAEMEMVRNFDFHKKEDIEKARAIVSAIDTFVSPVIEQIVASGKEAIVIGGGHNNAYPCIKGASAALYNTKKILTQGINVINCDAHSDFRHREGRHSGNAFSYAFYEHLLSKYCMIGLHESYNTEAVLLEMHQQQDRIRYCTFEEIFIRESFNFNEAITFAINFVKENYTGLEIDLDSIQNIPASAKTSSGISTIEARKFVYQSARSCAIPYFHIAEAAPVLSHIKTDLKTGKLVSYLISDYIKGRNEFHQKK